jgi:cytohesin
MMDLGKAIREWVEGGKQGPRPRIPEGIDLNPPTPIPLKSPEEEYETFRKVKDIDWSGDSQMAQSLHDHYVDVPDLVVAARVGYKAKLRELLDSGVDPNVQSKAGTTALMESLWRGDEETARLLLDRNASVGAALHCAATRGSPGIVGSLLAKGADPNARVGNQSTALMIAAEAGNSGAVRLLLEWGADPNLKDYLGSTALSYAASGGQDECGGDYRCVCLLLNAGADPNVVDHEGVTPLMSAAFYSDVESVRALLGRGADVSVKGPDGHTLLRAARNAGNTEVIAILTEAGAID